MRPNDESNGLEPPREIAEVLRDWHARSTQCPKPDLLQAAEGGVLSPELAEPLLRHVEICRTCKSLLRDLTEMDSSPLSREEQQKIWERIDANVPGRRSWFWQFARPWPIAAMAGVVALITVGLLQQRRPAAPVQVVQAPQKSAPVLALEKAPIVLPPAALLVWRGQQRDESSPWRELQTALLAYQTDDYSKASALLQPLTAKYPRMAEAWFYLGVSRLVLNSSPDAVGPLEEARQLAQPPLTDQAAWYLAVAYERAGRVDESRKTLDALCRANGADATRACNGLRSLPVIR